MEQIENKIFKFNGKKILKPLVTSCVLMIMSTVVNANVIGDNYIGADPINGSTDGDDVIGNLNIFDIHSVDYEITNTSLVMTIKTNFREGGTGSLGMEYGDLFFSTDGWSPFGSSPYKDDDAENGEDWELVFNTTEKKVFDAFEIITSDVFMAGEGKSNWQYRSGQEVQANTDNNSAIENGFFNTSSAGLVYEVPLSIFGNADVIGFHWGFSCANDVVEGEIRLNTVPEPTSLALLGLGLAGVGFSRKKNASRIRL